jgi:acetyl-CoA carboxylase beta subunit
MIIVHCPSCKRVISEKNIGKNCKYCKKQVKRSEFLFSIITRPDDLEGSIINWGANLHAERENENE